MSADLDVGTVHCVECHEPETDPDTPYRRVRTGNKDRWVCPWCDYKANAQDEPDDDL